MTAMADLDFVREPTGTVPMPFILLEGAEKSGKTYDALALSADPRIGHFGAIDLGEGSVDEYKPLGPYHVLTHDGTWACITDRIYRWLEVDRPAPERPNVLMLDTATALWDLVSGIAEAKTRARMRAKAAQGKGKAPIEGQDVQITQDIWNDVKKPWRKLMTRLMTWNGIVIFTARGGDVSKVENGRPVEGQKVWKVQSEKGLPYDASVVVRYYERGKVSVVGSRSLRLVVPPDRPLTIPDFTLSKLLDRLGVFDPGVQTGPRQMISPAPRIEDMPDDDAPPPRLSPVRMELQQLRGELTEAERVQVRSWCAVNGVPTVPRDLTDEQAEAMVRFITTEVRA